MGWMENKEIEWKKIIFNLQHLTWDTTCSYSEATEQGFLTKGVITALTKIIKKSRH